MLIKKKTLVNEIIIDFSVAINPINEIHVICLTKVGNLLYYIGSDDGWNHRLLSKLDIKSNIYRYLSLFIQKDYVHILCVKTNLLNAIVSSIEHMYWDDKNLQRSTVTSYLPGKHPSPYQVQIDPLNNIHIVYKVFYKNNHQLYYSKFNFLTKKWIPGEIITDLKEDHSHPYMLIDNKENLHLVWCTIEENNFILKYRKKANILSQKSKWSNIQSLSNKNANHISPIIIQQGSFLKVLSRQNYHISEIVSQDYGNSWTSVSKSKLYRTKKPLLIRYLSNFQGEKTIYCLQHVYGEITDHILLFGTKLYKLKEKNTGDLRQVSPTAIEVGNFSSTPSMVIEKDGGELPPSEDSSIINDNHLNKSNADSDLQQLLHNIEKHIALLMMELEKLQEIKGLLQNKSSAEDDSSTVIDCHSSNVLLDSFGSLEKNFSAIEKTQSTLEKDFEVFGEKLDSLDEEITLYREELLHLHEGIKEITYNTGFFNRIKNLFS
ncbi:hypothetical protein [Natronincola ferrireducens]|nr:hypothetical protein [Natronincola ferrireducens]